MQWKPTSKNCSGAGNHDAPLVPDAAHARGRQRHPKGRKGRSHALPVSTRLEA